jgi:hypothetical protein
MIEAAASWYKRQIEESYFQLTALKRLRTRHTFGTLMNAQKEEKRILAFRQGGLP